MGVEYRGAIVLGYEYDEACKIAETLGLDDVEELQFEAFAPSYDGALQDSIFGESLEKSGDYDYVEFDTEDVDNTAKVLADEYEANFGIRPRVYLMAQGW